MEFVELIINLLEKVSVLLATALVLLLLRPAEVWLGETGERASVRRRAFLVAVLSGLAIWGVFLGFEVGGMRFNVRMVGVIVAGYLGGAWVGVIVGAAAGVVDAFDLPANIALYAFAASLINGLLAGIWSKRLGTSVLSVVVGAVVIQAIHHVGIGAIMAAVDFQQAVQVASNLELHAAKIAANVIGVAMFMGLLNLVRELELARKEAQTSRDLVRSARLEALQYQVRPHFLFNLLNTLGYLIRTQPAKARELTLDLAEFLRYTLAHESDRTTLAEEFEQIERYVELERARFGEGLIFRIEEPPDPLAHQVIVPPLILQPLVENAIRHGSRDGEVEVCVDVDKVDDRLRIRVVDDGPGPVESAQGSGARSRTAEGGVGLTNVQERLERFYHEDTKLTLKSREGGGACVEFEIPISMSSPHPHTLREQAREQLKKVVS